LFSAAKFARRIAREMLHGGVADQARGADDEDNLTRHAAVLGMPVAVASLASISEARLKGSPIAG